MKKRTKIASAVLGLAVLGGGLTACKSDSDVVSENLSRDADNYRVARQIVVYNAITDKYILSVEGFCSLGNDDKADRVTYTCRKDGGYIKDIILKSDNTFVFVHQLDPKNVSTKFVKVILKPSTIVPDLDVR